MSSRLVVVGRVAIQNLRKVTLTERDDVIRALPANRTERIGGLNPNSWPPPQQPSGSIIRPPPSITARGPHRHVTAGRSHPGVQTPPTLEPPAPRRSPRSPRESGGREDVSREVGSVVLLRREFDDSPKKEIVSVAVARRPTSFPDVVQVATDECFGRDWSLCARPCSGLPGDRSREPELDLSNPAFVEALVHDA